MQEAVACRCLLTFALADWTRCERLRRQSTADDLDGCFTLPVIAAEAAVQESRRLRRERT